ncbi:MAG: ABC transporter permease subunit [Oscillospiraceae bacterium]|nr:ABC transporter permease subunit [Oscillospiraceae bacterium]
MLAIMKREIRAYFTSPLGYVFLAAFCAFSGLFLWLNCLAVGSAVMGGTFQMMFFVNMILIPVLTMRTLADDKRQKTDQLTLTSPVSIFGIVAGKFLGAFAVFLCASLVMLIYGVFLSTATAQSGGQFDWGSFWGYYAGLILMGAVFISIGIFISSLTESQMISAVGSIGVNIVVCLFDIISSYISNETLAGIINSLSVFYKYSEFTQGIFSLKNAVFFLSIIIVFNFLTIRVIERRRYA